jgi:hypothetical protein
MLTNLNPASLPVRMNRATGAALISQHFFPVSPRTLERWPVSVRRINGKALIDTVELLAVAAAKIESAPPVACGHTSKATA